MHSDGKAYQGKLVDGVEDFAAAVEGLSLESLRILPRICVWANALKTQSPITLQTYHGLNCITLLPRLISEEAGLVSIYNRRGLISIQFWRSVFERRAPQALVSIEEQFTPIKQGNFVYHIDADLLNTITSAYIEAGR